MSLSGLACCLSASTCCAITGACPDSGNGLCTKIMYAGILFLAVVVSCVMLAPGIEDVLSGLPFCKGPIHCSEAVGFSAVYRICFVVTLFFFLMALFTLGVRTHRDPRASIQNRYWGIKYLIVLAGCIGAFFIPEGAFGPTWMYFGLIGGFTFILVQLVLIIDVAHLWAEGWRRNYRETDNPNWYRALLLATILMYSLAFAVLVFSYSYYTGIKVGDCKLHEFFITFNFFLCITLSSVSILPLVQKYQENSGLLQGSFVSLYIMYLTWSAMSNQPDSLCKPDLTKIMLGASHNITDFSSVKEDKGGPHLDTASIIGVILWFICVIYSSIRTSSHSQAARLNINSDKLNLAENEEGRTSDNNDNSPVEYNWSVFHVMLGLATLYVMMTLTNWYSPGSKVDLSSVSANMSAVWIKILSSWFCFVMYIWTLIAPILLPDRDFCI